MVVMADLFNAYRNAGLAVRDAETLRDTRMRAWKAGCAEVAKCDVKDLDFTNIACSSNMTFCHVYKWREGHTGRRTGNGNRECIFCKLDDFDF